MKIHHLNCATFCPPSRLMVQGKGNPFARAKLVTHCLLLETSEGLVLIDTGLGTEDVTHPIRRLGKGITLLIRASLDIEETAIHQIRRKGFSPSDVRHIVLTHLDFDHAGALSDFPNARVHVLAAEHEAALLRKTPRERHRYRSCQWSHQPRWKTYSTISGERWFGFDCVRQLEGLPPEILLVPLSGHTRGHSAVAVQGRDGWLLHAGDAYFHHDEVHAPTRCCPKGLDVFQKIIQFDGEQRLRNQDRLRQLAREQAGKVRIFCAHDPSELAQFGPY